MGFPPDDVRNWLYPINRFFSEDPDEDWRIWCRSWYALEKRWMSELLDWEGS